MREYKQFMFHFGYPMFSIDARSITDDELNKCISLSKTDYQHIKFSSNSTIMDDVNTAKLLLLMWFPEHLI